MGIHTFNPSTQARKVDRSLFEANLTYTLNVRSLLLQSIGARLGNMPIIQLDLFKDPFLIFQEGIYTTKLAFRRIPTVQPISSNIQRHISIIYRSQKQFTHKCQKKLPKKPGQLAHDCNPIRLC